MTNASQVTLHYEPAGDHRAELSGGEELKRLLEAVASEVSRFAVVNVHMIGSATTVPSSKVLRQLDKAINDSPFLNHRVEKVIWASKWPGTRRMGSASPLVLCRFNREALTLLLAASERVHWAAGEGWEDLLLLSAKHLFYYSVSHEGIAELYGSEKIIGSLGVPHEKVAKETRWSIKGLEIDRNIPAEAEMR